MLIQNPAGIVLPSIFGIFILFKCQTWEYEFIESLTDSFRFVKGREERKFGKYNKYNNVKCI